MATQQVSDSSRKPVGVSEVIAQDKTKSQVPVMSLIKDDIALAAMVSKSLSAPDKVAYTSDGTRKLTTPDIGRLNSIANKTARNISEARTVMQMLPDQEHAMKIRIGAVLSPKDLMTVELNYSTPAGIVPATVSSHITSVISEHIENTYRIKNKLPRMLREIMFEKGSHVVAILAENAIDELINRHNAVSMESINTALESEKYGMSRGLLGPSDTVINGENHKRNVKKLDSKIFTTSLESIDLDKAYGKPNFAVDGDRDATASNLRVDFTNKGDVVEKKPKNQDKFLIDSIVFTDDANVLRTPMLEEKIRKDQVASIIGLNNVVNKVAMEGVSVNEVEGVNKISDRKLDQLLLKPRKNGWHQMEAVKVQSQLKRRTIGSPLLIELPPEAVIPVYQPGQQEKHVGYFVLLDQTGNPVRLENYKDVYEDMSNRFNFTESSQSSTVIDRLKQLTNGFNCTNQDHLDNTQRIWADMVEADQSARLRNSLHSNGVKIAKNHDYYLLMLSRMLSQQRTTILFLPVETTEYFAMKYDSNGIGVSYMNDMKILNNMQAIVIFANTMAALKNSIARTDVNLTIDEDDPDPQKTIDVMMDLLMRNNQSAFPLGIDSPADLVNYLSRAQYKFTIDGHPGLPQHKVEFSENNTNYQPVDTMLSDDLQKRRMMAMGLSPETAANGWNGESATEIVSNNLMLSKSAMTDQEILNPQLTSFVRKLIRVDQPLLEELRDIIDGSYEQLSIDEEEVAKELGLEESKLVRGVVVAHILNRVIEQVEVALPRPNTTSEQAQYEAMQTHSQLVDAAIEHYISSNFMTDNVGGEISQIVDDIQRNIKAMMMRQFMAEHGILPELGKLMSSDEMNEDAKTLWEQNQDYAKTLMKLLGDYVLKIKKAKDESNKVQEALGDSLDGGGSMSSFDTPVDNDEGDSDDGLGLPDDLSFDEPTTPETEEPKDDQPAGQPQAQQAGLNDDFA